MAYRIGIDARSWNWEGIGRYAKNLILRLPYLSSPYEFVVFLPKEAVHEIPDLPRTRIVPVADSYYSVSEQTTFLSVLLRERVDLMHFLHFNAPVLYRRPSIVTIHDLTRFFFPAQKRNGLFAQWAYEEVLRSAVMSAQGVIVVSQHTKNDLLRFFPQVADKTVIIHDSIEQERFSPHDPGTDEAVLASTGITKPYLLYVGIWINHKNLKRLVGAFRLLREQGYKGSLVITGEEKPHREDVPRFAQEMGVSDSVIFPGFVPDSSLAVLYRNADAFVFPSLYEGFGLPPLEAMASGTPVVCSYVASLPELYGNAAQYVNPLSEEDIAKGIHQVLDNSKFRSELISNGLRQAKAYDWDRTAKETLILYGGYIGEKESVVETAGKTASAVVQ